MAGNGQKKLLVEVSKVNGVMDFYHAKIYKQQWHLKFAKHPSKLYDSGDGDILVLRSWLVELEEEGFTVFVEYNDELLPWRHHFDETKQLGYVYPVAKEQQELDRQIRVMPLPSHWA